MDIGKVDDVYKTEQTFKLTMRYIHNFIVKKKIHLKMYQFLGNNIFYHVHR